MKDNMEKNIKFPLLKAIFFTFIPLVFAVIAGTIIVIKSLNENYSIIAQSTAFLVSIIVGFFILKMLHFSLEETGFCKIKTNIKNVLFFVPFIIIEILPFFTGLNGKNNFSRILLLLSFTIIVGINEELFFRGILIQVLKTKGIVRAVIISSALFGIGHIINIFAIDNHLYIILQIVFAFLFGIIMSEILIITKSIIPAIIIHAAHDFIANITNDSVNGRGLLVLGIQIIIVSLYIAVLWGKNGKSDTGRKVLFCFRRK